MTGDDELAEAVKKDYRGAPIDAKTRLILDFAVRLTLEPRAVDRDSVEVLRAGGWTDEEILTAAHIVGFFNYYVRLAEGLGVEPEEFMRFPRGEEG